MAKDDASEKKKDLTSLLDLPQAPEVPFDLGLPEDDEFSAESSAVDGDVSDAVAPSGDADPFTFADSLISEPSNTDAAFSPAPLPTGEETAHGELPAGFQTSQDEAFNFVVDEARTGESTDDSVGGVVEEADPFAPLPAIDPEIAALAAGNTISTQMPTQTAMKGATKTSMHPPTTNTSTYSHFSADSSAPVEGSRKIPTPKRAAAPSPAPRLKAPPAKASVDRIRDYSDSASPAAAAATPYSLLIEGELLTHERERLLEILAREKIGVREVEIEPQLAAGRILIPRISEYAGVLLAQALRNSQAKLRLGPSDRIFPSREADESSGAASDFQFLDDRNRRVQTMPVTSETKLPLPGTFSVVDTLHGSLLIPAAQLLTSRSAVVQESIEKLKTQMRLQAHFRGANGIVSFRTELHPHAERNHYTLLVQGVAVRTEP